MAYDRVLAELVRMIARPDHWTIKIGKAKVRNAGM